MAGKFDHNFRVLSKDNLEKIKKNHYIEFIYNNSPLQMDSRLLNEIIDKSKNEIIIENIYLDRPLII